MKKIFLSIAIISASIFASYAATNTNGTNTDQTRTECSKDAGKQKKDKKDRNGKEGRGMRAFEGITLTDNQKSQIEALRAEQKAQKEAAKKEREGKKESREKLTDEQRQQMKAEKQAQRQQAMEAFNSKVKAILTPEQYAKFLENTKEMAVHNERKDMKKDGRHSKNSKGIKDRHNGGKDRRGNSHNS